MTAHNSTKRDSQFIDETGRRHGKLVAISEAPKRNGTVMWNVRCDCGHTFVIAGIKLRRGRMCKHCRNRTHGMCYSPEYTAWKGMRRRCSDPKSTYYDRYGGRGIKVCAGWSRFEGFLNSVGRRPSDWYSIDRVDNDGHYSCGKCEECLSNGWPMNCRWATSEQQMVNSSIASMIDVDGDIRTATQWADSVGIDRNLIYSRKMRGITDASVLLMPAKSVEKIVEINGISQNVTAWAKEYGIKRSTLESRLSAGMDFETALNTPVLKKAKSSKANRTLTFNGETRRMKDWAKMIGISSSALSNRLHTLGWSVRDALTVPRGGSPIRQCNEVGGA